MKWPPAWHHTKIWQPKISFQEIKKEIAVWFLVHRNMAKQVLEVQCSLVNSDPDRVNASKEETPPSQNLSNLSLEEITEVKIWSCVDRCASETLSRFFAHRERSSLTNTNTKCKLGITKHKIQIWRRRQVCRRDTFKVFAHGEDFWEETLLQIFCRKSIFLASLQVSHRYVFILQTWPFL